MTIFNLEVSKYGIDLQTYFGDIYLYHRAWMLALVVVAALLVAKIIRKRNNEQSEVHLSDDNDGWI